MAKKLAIIVLLVLLGLPLAYAEDNWIDLERQLSEKRTDFNLFSLGVNHSTLDRELYGKSEEFHRHAYDRYRDALSYREQGQEDDALEELKMSYYMEYSAWFTIVLANIKYYKEEFGQLASNDKYKTILAGKIDEANNLDGRFDHVYNYWKDDIDEYKSNSSETKYLFEKDGFNQDDNLKKLHYRNLYDESLKIVGEEEETLLDKINVEYKITLIKFIAVQLLILLLIDSTLILILLKSKVLYKNKSINNIMDEKIKSGYVTGVTSLIASAILLLLAINSGLNLSGQMFGVFGSVFGFLGIGSILRPTIFGPITAKIIENFAKSFENESTDNNNQSQHKPKHSPQGYTKKGNVTIKQTNNYYSQKNKKTRHR